MSGVVLLDPHDRMTSKECLEYCLKEAESYDSLVIIGFKKDDQFFTRSSHMTRKDALWLMHIAIDWIMGKS